MFDYTPVTAPYPGLRPFEPYEGEVFFGREGHTDRLLEILQRERFLAVIGPSGSGKSSLVRAGLLPALAAGRLGTGSHWRLALLRPGGQPLLALAQALIAAHALGRELLVVASEAAQPEGAAPAGLLPATVDDATPDAALIAAELRRAGAAGLDRLLAQAQARREAEAAARDQPAPPPLNLLILADQFEEVFTYRDAAADPAEAEAFVDLLIAARDRGQAPAPSADGIRLCVALTLRTDFLGHCVAFAELPEAINRAQYLTPRLKPAEMHSAIVGPARLFGGDVEAGFAIDIIQQVGANSDQLPLLQHALARWWRAALRLNPAEPLITGKLTETEGDVATALDRHANQLFDGMNHAEQSACEALFRAITAGRDGGEAVRRPQRLADIATGSGIAIGTLTAVVEQLADPEVSFLHYGRELNTQSVIDLTHEALMRQWGRLKDWIASELTRGNAYRRWSDRLADHQAKLSGLLTGADLARALDWWNLGEEGDRWQPTAAWALRYRDASDPVRAEDDFEALRAFLIASRDAERAERDAEQRRLENEAADARRRADEERGRAEHERGLAEAATTSATRARHMSFFAVVIAAIAVLTAGFGYWQYQHAQQAEQARTLGLFESQLTHASLLARNEDYAEARKVLIESTKLDPAIAPERRHARNLLAGHVQTMGGAADKVYLADGQPLPALSGGVAVSPDGRYLAAAGERATLVLYDAASGALLKRLEGHDPKAGSNGHGSVRAIAFDPTGQSLYSGAYDGRVIRWSIPSGEKLGEWKASSGMVYGLAIRPDGRQLATGDDSGVITLWSLPEGRELRKLEGHKAAIADSTRSLVYSPDGQRLASTSFDRTARIWEVRDVRDAGRASPSVQLLHVLEGHNDAVMGADFSPDGKLLATASYDRRIVLWDVASGKPLRVFTGHQITVFGLRFSADGATLYSASRDNTLRAWDVASGATLRVFQGHEAGLWSVDLSPPVPDAAAAAASAAASPSSAPHAAGPQAWAYTAANDGTLRRWPLLAGRSRPASAASAASAGAADTDAVRSALAWTTEGAEAATSVAIAPNGRWAVVGMANGALRWHALPNGAPLGGIENAHGDQVLRVAFSPDGHTLATGSHDDKAKLWSVTETPDGKPSLKLLHTIEDHKDSVHAVAFSPDGRRLATASYDGQIGLFDVATGQGRTVKAHEGYAKSVSFDAKGEWLLTSGNDYKLRLWRADHLDQPPRELARLHDIPMWASLAPDGRSAAVVGRDQFITLLDLTRPDAAAQRLVGHEATVYRAIHSPDGQQLATVSDDMTLRLWDLGSRRLLFTQRLPAVLKDRQPSPLWDFDFRCVPETGDCWAVVPLTMGRVVAYRWPYEHMPRN